MKFKILTENQHKMIKTHRKGYYTFILHLAPYKNSGFNVCKHSTKGCRKACLNTAGMAKMKFKMDQQGLSSIERARRYRTVLFFKNPNRFFELLIADIEKIKRNHRRVGIRLNGTSDIPWERIPFTYRGKRYRNIMQLFPRIKFYDYTKYPSEERPELPENYHITYSISEDSQSWQHSLNWKRRGFNSAIVVEFKPSESIPSIMFGYPTIDGDEHDARFMDAQDHLVVLREKHLAKKDQTGFVIRKVENFFLKQAA